ncbi:MAG TPA: ester cyclase [Kofleriaceae bacterium]|nr:ester cyclase [Kofleriaceae bacterium]
MSESLPDTQHAINGLWELHLASEFAHKDTEEALATMTSSPRVTIVPTMIGGHGRDEMRTFYSKHFLNQLPPDLEIVPISRTIGDSRVVDELVLRFTHSIQMDWVLPGIPATNRRIELAMVVIVHVDGDRIASENIYWDSATILRQAGLLPDPTLPVLGAESARNMIDPAPLNHLIHRASR